LENNFGESLLHYAAAAGNQDMVEFLVDRGLDVNKVNSNGWTPLMCALTSERRVNWRQTMPRLVAYLLWRGADADVATDEGWTPLHALITQTGPLYDVGIEHEGGEWAVPLVRGLIKYGAPLDTEASFIRNADILSWEISGVWGHRVVKFLAGRAKFQNGNTVSLPGLDTTPLMWAMRCNAMAVFDELMARFAVRWETETEDVVGGIYPRL